MKFYKENNINPAASCLPILAQIPVFIALFFVLGTSTTRSTPSYPGSRPRLARPRPEHHRHGERALVGLPAARRSTPISQVTSTYFMSTTMDRAQRMIMLVLPLAFVFFIAQLPGRPRPLLGDDEPLDDGPGTRHAPAHAEADAAREARVADAAEGAAPATADGEAAAERRSRRAGSEAAAAPGEAQEEGRRADGEPRRLTGRGDRRDRRRGEVERAARARAAAARARQGGGALPGRLRGRARPARRRLRAGPRGRERRRRGGAGVALAGGRGREPVAAARARAGRAGRRRARDALPDRGRGGRGRRSSRPARAPTSGC